MVLKSMLCASRILCVTTGTTMHPETHSDSKRIFRKAVSTSAVCYPGTMTPRWRYRHACAEAVHVLDTHVLDT